MNEQAKTILQGNKTLASVFWNEKEFDGEFYAELWDRLNALAAAKIH